jgi:endonuclease G
LARARQVAREDSFHVEKIIPVAERAELADYTNSGYDRGHLAPAADMPSIRAQSESFSLANMTPQNPNNNRGIWSDIESATRGLVTKRGDLYIVSGPMFLGNKVQRMNGRVLVPTHYYKAIYDPKRQEAGAYVLENKENAVPNVISIAALATMSGVQVFPKLPAAVQNTTMNLPIPNSGN